MYSKILSDISQEYYKENYPNDGQRFVAWYLRNIHNLDTYETKDCITDGAGDKQIDAVYIASPNSLHASQSTQPDPGRRRNDGDPGDSWSTGG